MTRTGESPRRLTTAGFNPAWSPDGSQIVYATESTEARPEFRSENNSQIVVATLDTGATRTLPTGDAVQPSWSPHGWRVAYWGLWNRNQRDIWTIAVGGGSPVRVTSDAAIDWNPVWSIDGRWLYFCSDRSGTMNLWRVRIDEQTGATSGPPEAIVVPAPWVGQVALARDGTHLAYASYQRASNVYRVAFDPVRETLADRVDTVTRGSNQWQVSDMSRDGQSLAMTAATAGGQHVLVSDANGSSMRQLTFGAWLDVAPTWSPDGVTLGFFSNRSGRYQVWSVKQDGSELRQLTDVPDEGVFGPTWSPDGKRFTACAPVTFKCFMFEIAGGVTTMVAALPEPPDRQVQFDAYDWSSDGNWLAGGDFGVMVYSLRDKAYQRLTSVGREPQWLADGRRLVYLANGRLTLIDRLTGRSRDLSGSLHTDMRNMFLAHDGRSIYFTDLGLESDIWLMTLHD
jgi:Tol biopolymer transport system component